MNDKEALYYIKREIIKYKKELTENVLDEMIGNSVIYGSTLSSACIYSLLTENNKYPGLPYAIAVLLASLMSLKNHNIYSSSDKERKIIRELKKMKQIIVKGNNFLRDIEPTQFDDYINKKLKF